jgi:hypothetical protein
MLGGVVTMSSPGQNGPHWSQIDRGHLPPAPVRSHSGPKRAKGRRGLRLAAICAVGVIAIGVLSYFALDYVGVFSGGEGVPEDVSLLTSQIANEEEVKRIAAAEAALTERVSAWNALLESIAATGEDKTEELATFLCGTPDEVSQAAARYQEQWSSAGGEDGQALVVPGSMAIERIETGAYQSLASVVVTEAIEWPGGIRSKCVELTTWRVCEGLWQRTSSTMPYWCGGSGKLPIDQGVQVDGLVWSVERIQEVPPSEAADASGSLITVTFDVLNQDTVARSPGDFALCVWTPDGTRHKVSSLTDTMLPDLAEDMRSSLARDGHRTFTAAYEVPTGTELTTLAYEVVASSTVSSNSGPAATSTTTTTAVPHQSDGPGVEPGTPRAWALATSALLGRINGEDETLLGGYEPTAKSIAGTQQFLANSYNVNNREDLLAALEWVDAVGHRRTWEDLDSYLAGLSEDELQQVQDEVAGDYQTQHQVEMVLQYAPTLGSKSLVGWDYCRYVSLCRWGYQCGYITEDEAWDLIMPVAKKLQATFSSWEELGANYLLGREFWSQQEMLNTGTGIREAYQYLLTSPNSPWILNPWDMDLGVAGAGKG